VRLSNAHRGNHDSDSMGLTLPLNTLITTASKRAKTRYTSELKVGYSVRCSRAHLNGRSRLRLSTPQYVQNERTGRISRCTEERKFLAPARRYSNRNDRSERAADCSQVKRSESCNNNEGDSCGSNRCRRGDQDVGSSCGSGSLGWG